MNFKQTLSKAKEQNIRPITLLVADEVDCIFQNLSDEEFEIACDLIESAYLDSQNIDIEAIANALYKLVNEDKNKLESIRQRDILDIACEW